MSQGQHSVQLQQPDFRQNKLEKVAASEQTRDRQNRGKSKEISQRTAHLLDWIQSM